MNDINQPRPHGGARGPGEFLSFGGDGNGPNFRAPPAKKQPDLCPIVSGCRARLLADLLAESVEIAIAYGTGILRAVREADDESAIEQFRDFDAAARCARKCATELRSLLAVGAQ
jgi:hypothetical protein